jgi:hypothetical protein
MHVKARFQAMKTTDLTGVIVTFADFVSEFPESLVMKSAMELVKLLFVFGKRGLRTPPCIVAVMAAKTRLLDIGIAMPTIDKERLAAPFAHLSRRAFPAVMVFTARAGLGQGIADFFAPLRRYLPALQLSALPSSAAGGTTSFLVSLRLCNQEGLVAFRARLSLWVNLLLWHVHPFDGRHYTIASL